MNNNLVYHTGNEQVPRMPLERFLPLIPQGAAAAWLGRHISPGGWVLDPFGASPRLLAEIVRGGYRVLAAVHNPVVSFTTQILASAPHAPELNAALAQLGAAKFRDTRLEPHIRSLYTTLCPACGQEIEAQAFLWEKDATAPYARICTCPRCRESGEYPSSEKDRNRAAQYSPDGLHQARALERVAPLNDPDRAFAEEALGAYPGRAVYSLSTLINRLDGLVSDARQRRLIAALILNACDRANTLWPHPTQRERPRQLTVPPKYRENNIWLALEDALGMWASVQEPITLSHWPELPDEDAGIVLYDGRFKDIAGELASLPFEAIVSAIPRPNQAFWTLSALWSGWLWGAEAAEGFKSVLRRQRYGWRWHTVALHATLESVRQHLPAEIPFFGLLSEADAGFFTTTLAAAQHAGLQLNDVAMRPRQEQAQLVWQIGFDTEPTESSDQQKTKIRQQAHEYLQQRGEPGLYLSVLAAGLIKTAPLPDDVLPSEAFYAMQNLLGEAISYRGGLLHLDSAQIPESGYWWLVDERATNIPLSDRVEMACVRFLHQHPGSSISNIDDAICAEFTGLLTPSMEVLQCCLDSYGEPDTPETGAWSLREQDMPAARRQDLAEMAALLNELGARLGAECHPLQKDPLSFQWILKGEVLHTFYLTASALMGKIIHSEPKPRPGWIVLPGGRANLVAHKIAHNPALRNQLANDGWQFLKYRHLRYLSANPSLTLESLDEQFALDPLTYTQPQIRLF